MEGVAFFGAILYDSSGAPNSHKGNMMFDSVNVNSNVAGYVQIPGVRPSVFGLFEYPE